MRNRQKPQKFDGPIPDVSASINQDAVCWSTDELAVRAGGFAQYVIVAAVPLDQCSEIEDTVLESIRGIGSARAHKKIVPVQGGWSEV